MSDRTTMIFPSPARPQARVRAGVAEFTVAGSDPTKAEQNLTVRRPIYIHTTRVMKHALAVELRSRAHTLVTAEAAGS